MIVGARSSYLKCKFFLLFHNELVVIEAKGCPFACSTSDRNHFLFIRIILSIRIEYLYNFGMRLIHKLRHNLTFFINHRISVFVCFNLRLRGCGCNFFISLNECQQALTKERNSFRLVPHTAVVKVMGFDTPRLQYTRFNGNVPAKVSVPIIACHVKNRCQITSFINI